MAYDVKNFAFVFDVVDMLALDNVELFHGLKSELLGFVSFQTCDLDVTEGACKKINK